MRPREEDHLAGMHARALLDELGWHRLGCNDGADHPAVAWARSGLMDVTGWATGPGLMCPAPLAATADGAMAAFAALAGFQGGAMPTGSSLLGQRARLRGLRRSGQRSPGGACRLLSARDGWIALSLPRDEDWVAVPAWLDADLPAEWKAIGATVRERTADDLVRHGRLLGLAVARADDTKVVPAWRGREMGAAGPLRARTPVVVDLSSLWAGPLAGALLRMTGAEVIKVEGVARPDGARMGHGGFFDWLNGGKRCVAIDFSNARGQAALRALLRQADIIIEASRPRALRQIGVVAEEFLERQPALVWVSLTAYGRDGAEGDCVGFGDDAAVAAGLSRSMADAYGQMMFAGDAIADPLTGLHAAVAAWSAWRQREGGLISLSLAGVTARAVQLGTLLTGDALAARAEQWTRIAAPWRGHPYDLPIAPSAARRLGADNAEVLSELSARC
jgi:crotonobetainyl-CoA:carnitine CoA-transferase CaiB-like acyl-CoA transferase